MLNSLLLTLASGIFILLGGLFILLFKNQKNIHSFSIGLSIGVLIILLISDMIPEAYELLIETFGGIGSIIILMLVSILGILLIKLLDSLMGGHHHAHKEENTHVAHMASVALSIHNIVEGMALFMTCMIDIKVGLLLVLGVSMHNLVLGLSVGSEYYSHSKDKKGMIKLLIFLSASTFIGGVIMAIFNVYLESNYILGIILSITIGMIIYIVFLELIPHFFELKDKKVSIYGFILGIILMLITTFLE